MSNEIEKFFTADHGRLDSLLEAFIYHLATDIPKACEYFHLFKDGLLQHIEWEEDILFKIFEDKTGNTDGPTLVMREEHRQIKTRLNKIASFSADEVDFMEHIEELKTLLRTHNQKEEQILYPMIQRCCKDHELSKVFLQIGKMPQRVAQA
jgi:regulator of cell morphogenesis and NO signaling